MTEPLVRASTVPSFGDVGMWLAFRTTWVYRKRCIPLGSVQASFAELQPMARFTDFGLGGSNPMPASGTLAVLRPLLGIVRSATRPPALVGVKVTLTEHVPPTAIVWPLQLSPV